MFEIGEVVEGRYVVEDLLGEGGLAQVWRVRHNELGSHHALKVLLFRKAKLAERLILEGRIQAQLRHPNIVSVTDVVRLKGRVGLLMEYIDGVSLEDFLYHQENISLDQALPLFASILSGVHAAHSAGVLHRDLKPANILLARGSRGLLPKVADFGIAKVVEGSDSGGTRAGAVMGTPGYLAPEQAQDASAVDNRADIFALGAIFYEILAGHRAFDITDVLATAEQTPPTLTEVLSDCPEYIDWAMQRAMAVNPDDRYPTVDAFAEDLFTHHPELLRGIRDLPDLSLRSLSLPTPAGEPARSVGSAPPTTPLEDRPPGVVPRPTIAPINATITTEEDSQRWVILAGVGLVMLAGLGLLVRMSQPAPTTQTDRPQAVAPIPKPPAAMAVAATATPVRTPVAEDIRDTPTPTPGKPVAKPTPEPRSAAIAAATPTPREATPTPEAATPTPQEATPTPEAATPAPTPTAAPTATPTPAAEPTPRPTTVATYPKMVGTWSGKASGRPARLVFSSQKGAALAAELVFILGPTQRRHQLRGEVGEDGKLVLSEPSGSLELNGLVAGSQFVGTYSMAGQKKVFPISLSWSRQ